MGGVLFLFGEGLPKFPSRPARAGRGSLEQSARGFTGGQGAWVDMCARQSGSGPTLGTIAFLPLAKMMNKENR